MLPIRTPRLAGALAAGLVGAVLAPLAQHRRTAPADSFPFSSYPMFTAVRTGHKREHYLVGVDAQGGRRLLHYGCAGTGGHNQVRRQVDRLVREGRADELCRQVAGRVARRSGYDEVVTVEVVTGTYDLAEYFSGDREPASERVRASRAVRQQAGDVRDVGGVAVRR